MASSTWIKAPTLLVFGDADSVSLAHAALPGMTHYDIFASPILIPTIMDFLAAPLD